MPLPVLPSILMSTLRWGGAIVGGSMLAQTALAGYAPLLEPTRRGQLIRANRRNPNSVPELQPLIGAWSSGLLEWCDLKPAAQQLGISLGPSEHAGGPPGSPENLWRRIIQANLPILDWHTARTLAIREPRFAEEWQRQIRRSGMWRAGISEWLLDQREALPPELVRRSLALELLHDEDAEKHLRCHGYTDEYDRGLLLHPPFDWSVVALFSLWNRGLIPDSEGDRILDSMFGGDKRTRDMVAQLRLWFPPPTDLIRFAVRDSFLPSLPGRDEMVREYAEQTGLREALQAQGIGPVTYRDRAGNEHTEDFGLHEWLAHYHRMSPSQAFECLHRLREGRAQLWAPPGVTLRPFLISDVQALLKQDDYAPQDRDPLAAISYRVIGKIDLRRIYREKLIDLPELIERNQDFGLTESDAKLVAQWTDRDAEKQRRAARKKATRPVVAESLRAYRLGVMDSRRLQTTLSESGYTQEEADYVHIGADLSLANDTAKEIIGCVRRRYLSGELTVDQARSVLERGGIAPTWSTMYLERWARCLTLKRRSLAKGEILDMVRAGVLSPVAAMIRLQNLGYDVPDVNLLMAMTALEIEQDAARTLKAERQATERAAAQLAKAIREREAATEKMRATLRRLTSVKQLVAWLTHKPPVISVGVFSRRMRAMGYPQDVIMAHLAEHGFTTAPVEVNGEANGEETEGEAGSG